MFTLRAGFVLSIRSKKHNEYASAYDDHTGYAEHIEGIVVYLDFKEGIQFAKLCLLKRRERGRNICGT